MAVDILKELESAAKIVLAPPSIVTNEQRHIAEQVFLNFRQTKAPYPMCKLILETCQVDYVLFETAGTLKDALIREWSMLQENEITELRQYLFDYVSQRINLAPFVRERILQVLAIMIKRGSVNDMCGELQRILSEVEQLIMGGDYPRQILGCSIILAIMQEYSNTLKSSDVGLTWEVHFKAKSTFEKNVLLNIFKICVRGLSEIVPLEPPYPDQAVSLMRHLLMISETVLTWGGYTSLSLSKKMAGAFERTYNIQQAPSLKPNLSWKSYILDPKIVLLHFDIHWKVRGNPSLGHHSMTCLVQLASLNGSVIESRQEKLQYFDNYLQAFLKFVSSVEIFDREALGLSNILRNLIIFFPPMFLHSLHRDLRTHFLEQVARLTCFFAEGAAHEESMHADDCMFREAFENMLKSWMGILTEVENYSKDFYKQSCIKIFNTYLKCHLGPSDGTRGSGKDLYLEEVDESEESDRVRFKDQLQAIGIIGRQVLGHSLPLLIRLIEERTAMLSSLLEKIHLSGGSYNISESTVLINLFEDLHWLILISGHTIADDVEGESVIIREPLIHSIEQQAPVEPTLKLLLSPHLSPSDIPNVDSADHLVRLTSAVFRLCDMETKLINAKKYHLLSPELTATLVWFLQYWENSYLLPDESCYLEISLSLVSAFGQNSEGSVWCVNFLINKIESLLVNFSSEPSITEAAVKLLTSLIRTKDKASSLMKCGVSLRGLVELQRRSQPLPKLIRIGLMKVFIVISIGLEDSDKRQQHWQQIVKPLEDRFRNVISQENFSSTYQDENIKNEIIQILESYIGVVQGSQIVTVHELFNLVSPVLFDCSTLMNIYCQYRVVLELILELFRDTAKGMLCYLTGEESRRFFDASLRVIQSYARSNSGRLSIDPSSAEEEAYSDIILLIALLMALLSKDYIDLSPSDNGQDLASENSIGASDVTLYGLGIIMPLMTVDLLKFPTLSNKYFKLITFLSELHPEKVIKQSPEMLRNILASVELGLVSFSQDVSINCCDFIQEIASYIYNTGKSASFKLLTPFLKMVIDMILFRQVNSDVLPNIGQALFALICCYKDEYERIVQGWISSQKDLSVASRLAQAFTDLTSEIALNTDRQQKARFRDSFEKFIINVHGFLFVK